MHLLFYFNSFSKSSLFRNLQKASKCERGNTEHEVYLIVLCPVSDFSRF